MASAVQQQLQQTPEAKEGDVKAAQHQPSPATQALRAHPSQPATTADVAASQPVAGAQEDNAQLQSDLPDPSTTLVQQHAAQHPGSGATGQEPVGDTSPEGANLGAASGSLPAHNTNSCGQEPMEMGEEVGGARAEGKMDGSGGELEVRLLSGLEAEVATMLSGMPEAAEVAAAIMPPKSMQGLPVLPDAVRNKDLKRELPLMCHVIGCGLDLSTQADYYQRYRICKHHLKSPAMVVDGVVQRFCQQCGRYQLLEEFDGDKRNCRARLQQHNSRRRKVFAMNSDLKKNRFGRKDAQLVDMEEQRQQAEIVTLAASLGNTWDTPPPPPLPAPAPARQPAPLLVPNSGLQPLPAGKARAVRSPGAAGPMWGPAAFVAPMAAATGGALDTSMAADNQQHRLTGHKRDLVGLLLDALPAASGSLVARKPKADALLAHPGPPLHFRLPHITTESRAATEPACDRGLLPANGNPRKVTRGSHFADAQPRSQAAQLPAVPAACAPRAVQQVQLLAGGQQQQQEQGNKSANPFLASLRQPVAGSGGALTALPWTPVQPAPPPHQPSPLGLAPRPPASALLEQMARRVLMTQSQGEPGWAPPPAVHSHPEAQPLLAIYPQLAASITHLSQQLQLAQSQRAYAAAEASASDTPLLQLGWQQVSPPSAQVLPPPPPPQQQPQQQAGHTMYTAEDMLRAFAAGQQQQQQAPSAAQLAPQQPSRLQPEPGPTLQDFLSEMGGGLSSAQPLSWQQQQASGYGGANLAAQQPPSATAWRAHQTSPLAAAGDLPRCSSLEQLAAALLTAQAQPAADPGPTAVVTFTLQELAALLLSVGGGQ